jgi:phage tail protein X
MSPTHANKRGVRYRYYVSHAILQNRKAEAGNIARVPAPEIETLVCDSVRRLLAAMGEAELPTALADRDLIEHHVARVIVKPQALEVCLIPTSDAPAQTEDPGLLDSDPHLPPTTTITLPWTAPSFAAVKGIIREVHRGEHEPILTRDLFEAVQAKRVANAVARHVRLGGSAAILTGRLFDDRGNRMSPTHANKRGVRYRYYVSHAILQNRKAEAGSIARVPAPEIETLVCDSVRRHLAAMGEAELPTALADRDLIEHHVARVIVKPQALEVCLIPTSEASAQREDPGLLDSDPHLPSTTTITLPWTAPSFAAVKGIIHAPCAKQAMRPESRDALLTAIAKARGWIDDIRFGRIASFAEIAERKAQGERHIRLLAPLAFLSPRIIAAIVDGTAPADLTVTSLAKALPYSWIEQEQSIGL